MSISCEYRNTLQGSELILFAMGKEKAPDFLFSMFSNNQPHGLLPFTVRLEEGAEKQIYQVGTKKSLTDWLEFRKLSQEELVFLSNQLIEIMIMGKQYLLDEDDYVLRPECIFLGKDEKELYLCYYPMYQTSVKDQLSDLYEYLMGKIDYKDSPAVVLLYELYMLTKEKNCSFESLREAINREDRTFLATNGKEYDGYSTSFRTKMPGQDVCTYFLAEEEGCQRFGEEGEKETTGYQLLANREEETIDIPYFPYYLEEKEKRQKEGFLFENETKLSESRVLEGRREEKREEEEKHSEEKETKAQACTHGRRSGIVKAHARLSLREDVVYLEDMKSKHGTFLNGRRLVGNEMRRLCIGDHVILGDRSYRFVKK